MRQPSTGFFGRLQSGEVVRDRSNSHVSAEVFPVLSTALARVEGGGRNIIKEVVKFDKTVGYMVCVRTNASDGIVFAQREGRRGLSRFALDRVPEPTDTLTVVLKRTATGEYVVITAFFGADSEPEPWDEYATAASLKFWEDHALVLGSAPIVPGTATIKKVFDFVTIAGGFDVIEVCYDKWTGEVEIRGTGDFPFPGESLMWARQKIFRCLRRGTPMTPALIATVLNEAGCRV